MPEGKIIKATAGFYYVLVDGKIYECRARGLFKLKDKTPLVGDNVIIKAIDERDGYILEILDRKNRIMRPPVANVDVVVLVASAKAPEPSFLYIDRILAMCEYGGIDCIICVNKIDIDYEGEYKEWSEIYLDIGYPVFYTSAKLNIGVYELSEYLTNKISVFAGNSGVGKSSLLNAMRPGLKLNVGDISSKSKKGTHTTRHIELIKIYENSYVADTPGFNELSIDFINRYDLSSCFREFNSYECRFSNCLHQNEPGCSVKEAVNEGKIHISRYLNYLKLLGEIVKSEGELY
ncbi:ribosome small subunit-dependent GTPase A [Calorimonas adulescens]|uniref:Small ribosomal subunit biogenesis GTPase RsgA n=1 Tax=Calorimonas adulescens TaxID=2606906 RepID=A0A5D8QHP6_9THEO|nr:ribosome small subunit-dependent GTPase A [Calorimonas adulescens]TZE83406.1 ribosome small subunit-dependent GTPase A [Calorimonas adulescens]